MSNFAPPSILCLISFLCGCSTWKRKDGIGSASWARSYFARLRSPVFQGQDTFLKQVVSGQISSSEQLAQSDEQGRADQNF